MAASCVGPYEPDPSVGFTTIAWANALQASFQFDDYAEKFQDSAFARIERMPGVFGEYTMQRADFTLVTGVRADMNSYYGNVVSPRIHLKYDLGPLTNVRLSAGRGFRTANPLVESASVLASSRRVVVEGPLGMERSWNFGASFLHKFKWLERKWAMGVDAYRTEFTSQVVTILTVIHAPWRSTC